MGKGIINSHIGAGQYSVTLTQDQARLTSRTADIDAVIADIETRLAAMDPGEEKTYLSLVLTSYEKEKEYLENNAPEDITLNAWCADLTEDLTGDVGTIEVPGEIGTVNIQPGYDGNAVYDAARDGILQPAIANTPFGCAMNWALFPAWQKWKPTFRYGTISNLSGDTCTVTLDAATSSHQSLNINQGSVLTAVPIEYMTCNGAAFVNGDEVIVQFTGQDWASPKVIGFKDEPKACGWVENWGETLTENHAWTYQFIKSNPPLNCNTLGCGGEGYLEDGVLRLARSVTTNSDSIRLICPFLPYYGATESPIIGAETLIFKIGGGGIVFPTNWSGSQITLFLDWGDENNDWAGMVQLFLQAGPYWYDNNAFRNPCEEGEYNDPDTPAYDLSSLNPLSGNEIQFDLTQICNYTPKILEVYFFIVCGGGGSYQVDFDYIRFE